MLKWMKGLMLMKGLGRMERVKIDEKGWGE